MDVVLEGGDVQRRSEVQVVGVEVGTVQNEQLCHRHVICADAKVNRENLVLQKSVQGMTSRRIPINFEAGFLRRAKKHKIQNNIRHVASLLWHWLRFRLQALGVLPGCWFLSVSSNEKQNGDFLNTESVHCFRPDL